jgi:hypothetical protein
MLARPIWHSIAGDVDGARAAAERAVAAARRVGQPSALALALYARGSLGVQSGLDVAAAERDCEESIRLTSEGACDVVYHNTLSALAHLRWSDGDHDGALRFARDGLAHAFKVGDRPPVCQPVAIALVELSALGEHVASARTGGSLLEGAVAPYTQVLHPALRAAAADAMVSARRSLGHDRFEHLYSEGAAQSYDQAIRELLAALDDVVPRVDP